MAIRINNINLNIDEDISLLKNKAVKKLKVSPDDIKNIEIIKESIDARKKHDIKFKYSLLVGRHSSSSFHHFLGIL